MTDVQAEVPVTEEEKEQILRHALGLIREPVSWTTGSWKCPMPEFNPDWTPKTNPKTGVVVQATDDNGRPLFQYCVHGALNQATYDILGEERATKLGALNPFAEGNEKFNGGESNWGVPATWLGLDEIALEEHGIEAMTFNDRIAAAGRYDNEEVAKQHQGVLHMLRKRLSLMHEDPPGGKAA